jgi:hypothetical protein
VYGERMRRHARNWFAWDTPAEYPWREDRAGGHRVSQVMPDEPGDRSGCCNRG